MAEDANLEQIRAHEIIWKKLYDKADAILKEYSSKYTIGDDGYWIVDDDWGWDILQIELTLDLLRSDVVKSLQRALAEFPDWTITLRADLRGLKNAPGMGLFVYPDRIVDDLKRDHLPPKFRDISFG